MFNGFLPPTENWSKLPNELIDQLSVIDTLAEMKVILYVLRHTWGFQDEWKKITIDEFANGRKRKDGSRLDGGTGMSEPSIRNGIDKAIEHGFLIVETDDRDKGRIRKYYCLNSQGEKDLPPDQKEFTPCGKETLPRTEKETVERNQKKHNGIEKDFIDTLPTYQPGSEQIAQPDGFQQHFGYRQEVLKAYNDETNLVPNQGRKAILAELAARPGFDLERFKAVLHKFNAAGGNPYDIEAIVKAYDGGNGNGSGKARIPLRHPGTGEIIPGAWEL